jgi:hypothetical protein
MRRIGGSECAARENAVSAGWRSHALPMDTPTRRIAREITIMLACGGPLSRADWMAHLAQELAAARPLPRRALNAVAEILDGSYERAEHFVYGVLLMDASFAADPASPFLANDERSRALLADSLEALAIAWTACEPQFGMGRVQRAAGTVPRDGFTDCAEALRRVAYVIAEVASGLLRLCVGSRPPH